jgi:hypothetical protein
MGRHRMRLLTLVSKIGATLVLGTGSLFAQGSVIFAAAPGSGWMGRAEYGLNVIRALDAAGDVQLASFPDNNSLNNFLTAAASDPTIASAEIDRLTQLVESNPGSTANVAAAATSLDPLVQGSQLSVDYFGNTTLQGYIQQPAAVLIGSPMPRRLSALGILLVQTSTPELMQAIPRC